MKKMRLIYAGTPDFAVPALHALHHAGHEIVAVLTQPDRPAGRGQKLRASPVKQAALELGLTVLQPLSLRKAEIKRQLRALNADAMIVAAYGLILPQSVLDMPRLGCLNIHASLLPRWRGAAPIHRALEAGDVETGITIMQMDAGLDTGNMLSAHAVPISDQDTSQTLHDALAKLGGSAIVSALDNYADLSVHATVQNDELATYAHKLKKSEAKIDWNASAQEIAQRVRAFNPWPCAYSYLEGKHFKVWNADTAPLSMAQMLDPGAQHNAPNGTIIASNINGIFVQTGKDLLRIKELQVAGKKRVSFLQFINATDLTGKVLISSVK